MKTGNQLRIYGKKTALQLSIIISIILVLIMLISYAYARSKDFGKEISISDVINLRSILSFLINALMLYFLFRFQFWSMERNTKPHKRVWITILGSLALLFVLSPLFAQIQWWLLNDQLPIDIYVTIQFIKDLVVLMITLLFTALIYIWDKNQKILVENQRLSIENLQNRYDALKNQVEPHFLFNSLNTLNGLIGYEDDKAHEYLDQLSLVFRYTMQNKQIIQLEDELDFVKSYSYLMKIRYNESLQIEYDLHKEYLEYYILPFGLQLLIENAVKHNIISKKYPLFITIQTTDKETIVVKNNLQMKLDRVSEGVGLANLNERYKLMFGKEIIIYRDGSSFMVEIPLIRDLKKYNKFGEGEYENCYCRR